jgi:NAD(P)-dependent dehydrogenase (short-subunit alcohol dehydrogenase family)
MLLRTLGKSMPDAPIEISIVTDQAHDVVGTEAIRPYGAMALGITKVAPIEYPSLRCRAIDLERTDDVAIERLISELESDVFVPVAAYRGPYRWCEAYRPLNIDRARPRLAERGVYLITGGLGGVGFALAEHLARTVRARLILVGRNAEAAAREGAIRERIEAMTNCGADVLAISADVRDRDSLATAVTRAQEAFGRIDGVVHAAGIAGGGVMQAKTIESLRRVTEAKILGAINLAALVERPDFIVLCSSVASITGGFGQVDYVAANAFLDAYSRHMTMEKGVEVISMNWSAWNEVGMAVTTEVPEALKRARETALVHAIEPREGVLAFERALGAGVPRIVVASQDLDVYFEAVRPPAEAEVPIDAREAERPVRTLARDSLTSSYVEPRSETEKKLAETWQALLSVEPIGVDDNFFELGGNSLIALQLLPDLRKQFGAPVSSADLFERTTIRLLAELLDRGSDAGSENDAHRRRGEAIRKKRADGAGRRAP